MSKTKNMGPVKRSAWKVYNQVYSLWTTFVGELNNTTAPGLLPHREDSRDFGYNGDGSKDVNYDPANDPVGSQWRFLQMPFNCCVFASAVMAASWQNGVRFSVRWMVKLAKREGYISGNGFSFLRAPKKLARKYGHLPAHYMPDTIGSRTWREYSAWTSEDEELLEVAKQFRIKEYQKINRTSEAKKALKQGFCLCTGSKWYSAMNYLRGFKALVARGSYIGGHAYADTSHENNYFVTTNSFGRDWGRDGQAIDLGLFEAQDYSSYIEAYIDVEPLKCHVAKEFAGKAVKGTGAAIYVLEDGKKRPFAKESQYNAWLKDTNNVSFIPLRDRILNAIPEGKQM